MGCGGQSKETNDTVHRHVSHQPSLRPFGSRLLPDPRNKLAPEVLEGFTKLIKSFYCNEFGGAASKAPAKDAPGKQQAAANEKGATAGATGRTNDVVDGGGRGTISVAQKAASKEVLEPEKVKEALAAELAKRQEQEAEEARRQAEYQAKSVSNPFQDLLSRNQEKAEEAKSSYPVGAGREAGLEAEEHRRSPEPPRPEELSDDEDEMFEDPGMRAARLEKERRAKEEAEQRAAQQRLEEERVAAQRKGAMSNMQSEAESILSKYQ